MLRNRTLSTPYRRNILGRNLFQLGIKGYEIDDDALSVDDVIVAVMGPTGSGKSSFIEMATGMVGMAGHSLESCTNKISVIKLSYPGLNLCFVDTPGFDDTHQSDLTIFKMISDWLSKTYKKQIRLTCLLYFHRISDVRVAGTSLKNLRLFDKLCGENFNNIIFTTTMWDDVDEQVGAQREQELKRDFWRPMIDRGATMKRFLYTPESAFEILLPIFAEVNTRSTRALLLQHEVNDRRMKLRDTSAGRTLYMELGELVTRHQEVLERIRRELRDLDADPDQLRFLLEDYQKVSMQLQRAAGDMQNMRNSARDQTRRLRNRKEMEILINLWQENWQDTYRVLLEEDSWKEYQTRHIT